MHSRFDLRSMSIDNLRNYYPCKQDDASDERFGFLLPLITGGLIGFPLGYLVNNKEEKVQMYPYYINPPYPQQYPEYPNTMYPPYPYYNYQN